MFELNKDITRFTTFGLPAKAAYFAEYSSSEELKALTLTPEFSKNQVLHIGGGSNLVFIHDFNGVILHSAIRGIEEYSKNEEEVFVMAGAGEKWTDLVDWCVERGIAGLENLAGIPGEVGAAPVQNVGAYGVEAKDVIHSVVCFDILTREKITFFNDYHKVENKSENRLGFSYRDSRFKHEWKGRYYVLKVSFRLRRSSLAHNLEYEALKKFAETLDHQPSIKEVAEEVVRLRDSKLPDPSKTGSVGSFFKNPIVSRHYFEQAMLALDPDIKSYPEPRRNENEPEMVKVPAGWLIEHAGLKGMRIGGAQVDPKNALVIINTGNATGKDVETLARSVVDHVRERFAIALEREANYVDSDLKVTILGSGTSKGVPEVGCLCRVCRSRSNFDHRLRASALVRTMGLDLLIDVSPDFRPQALREDLYRLDAVLLTHSHYDHVGGIDDLRPFCAHRNVPIYLKHDVNDDLHRRLDYCFRDHPYPGVPTFDMHEIDSRPFFIDGVEIIPIKVMHGTLPILGYRIGKFAYITDAKTIDEDELEKLEGLDVLIINALRFRPHFSHLSIEEALSIIKRIKPKEAYLTHFNHEVGLHEDLSEQLPPNVHPCYDGLKLTIK
ncbi:MAG: UDP-N-acetylmuramate dehydrogenase [Muribaculaceae bacterium]|nr:UDP-N-acetylmuramate dehydrogenase [Muribaculaceae bacterium]